MKHEQRCQLAAMGVSVLSLPILSLQQRGLLGTLVCLICMPSWARRVSFQWCLSVQAVLLNSLGVTWLRVSFMAGEKSRKDKWLVWGIPVLVDRARAVTLGPRHAFAARFCCSRMLSSGSEHPGCKQRRWKTWALQPQVCKSNKSTLENTWSLARWCPYVLLLYLQPRNDKRQLLWFLTGEVVVGFCHRSLNTPQKPVRHSDLLSCWSQRCLHPFCLLGMGLAAASCIFGCMKQWDLSIARQREHTVPGWHSACSQDVLEANTALPWGWKQSTSHGSSGTICVQGFWMPK